MIQRIQQATPNDPSENVCELIEDQDSLQQPMPEQNYVNSNADKTGKYKCHLCERSLCNSYYLARHVERHIEKSNQHHCPLCNLKFLTKALYKKHSVSAHQV